MIPKYLKPFLWSYNFNNLDVMRDRRLIIAQLLNYGDVNAVRWVIKQYGVDEVRQIANTIPVKQWDNKSLAYWKLILDIKPQTRLSKISTGG